MKVREPFEDDAVREQTASILERESETELYTLLSAVNDHPSIQNNAETAAAFFSALANTSSLLYLGILQDNSDNPSIHSDLEAGTFFYSAFSNTATKIQNPEQLDLFLQLLDNAFHPKIFQRKPINPVSSSPFMEYCRALRNLRHPRCIPLLRRLAILMEQMQDDH